jgi:hypothetical protein
VITNRIPVPKGLIALHGQFCGNRIDSTFVGSSLMSMTQENGKADENELELRPSAKKPYEEPAFRHERVFETMALNCSKAAHTSLMCGLGNHKNS